MPGKLLLIRHGPSTHRTWLQWVNAAGVRAWRDAYDRAGITADCSPPSSLVAAVSRCDLLISSDLPRAIESAQRLAPGRPLQCSALLRESPLATPDLPLRLPVVVWDTLSSLQWGVRILRGTDDLPGQYQRATEAAAWLNSRSSENRTIAVITHGVFRRYLAKRMRGLGWQVSMPRPRYEYWSVWTAKSPDSMVRPTE